MQKFDLHMHSNFSHGKASPEDMVLAAIEQGFTTIGIAEHVPRLDSFRYSSELGQPIRGLDRWQNYLSTMRKLRDKYRSQGVAVLVGCEMDWMGAEQKDYCAEQIRAGAFDYMIGSVHFLTAPNGQKIGFDYAADWDLLMQEFEGNVVKIYANYFTEYAQMVESGLFQIAGHLDLIKIFREHCPLPKTVDILQLAQPALAALQKSKMVIEINAGGLDKGCKEFYPNEVMLRETQKLGIPVTFGSDAHSVERVGAGFNQAVDLASKVGYTEMIVFGPEGERRRQVLPLRNAKIPV